MSADAQCVTDKLINAQTFRMQLSAEMGSVAKESCGGSGVLGAGEDERTEGGAGASEATSSTQR